MIVVVIDHSAYVIKEGASLIEACKYAGIFLPRFCYHESLSISGNCRMCLVRLADDSDDGEITNSSDNTDLNFEEDFENVLVVACVKELDECDFWFITNDSIVKKARENILEFLLLNHPLDCPICDQAGECDLQDQAKKFGFSNSKYYKNKESTPDKYFNPFIKTIMSRCIHCTRCIRFSNEIVGSEVFGMINRGSLSEISFYLKNTMFNSEISGNVIDLCPVGALTSKTYAFKNRPWELKFSENLDLTDSLGSNIYINYSAFEIVRIFPKNNYLLNKNFISDKCRFSFDSFNTKNLLQNPIKKGKKVNTFIKLYSDIFNNKDFLKNALILVNEELSIEQLNVIKNLSIENENITVRSLNKNLLNSNIFLNQNSFVQSIDKIDNTCFFFAINPKTECSLLNVRIRYRIQDTFLNLFSIGAKVSSFNKNFYVNFHLSHFLSFLEGKIKSLSTSLVSQPNSLILTGPSFYERGFNLDSLKKFLLMINKSLVFFKIPLYSNSFGNAFLNIRSLNSKDLINKETFFLINLKENFMLEKLVKSFSKRKIFWISPFKSKLKYNFEYEIPIKSFYENDGLYINLEGRPQTTQKLFVRKNLSLYTFFSNLYNLKKTNNDFINLKFEQSRNSELFNENTNFYLSIFKKNYIKFRLLSLYPSKHQINDFYLTNYFTINSKNMIKASVEYKKVFNNFY